MNFEVINVYRKGIVTRLFCFLSKKVKNHWILELCRSFGSSDGQFSTPHDAAVDDSGNVYIVDLSNNRFQVFGVTRGDINRNGRLDTGDATLILRYIVNLPIPQQYLPVPRCWDWDALNTLVQTNMSGISVNYTNTTATLSTWIINATAANTNGTVSHEWTWNVTPYTIFGLDFSPYMDGQYPSLGSQISEEQLRARMAIIAPHTQWIRTFGSTHGLENASKIAHEMGLKAAVGAWLSKDLSDNELEISNLISAAKAGHVDLAIVGSEVLLRGDLSESQLVGYINRVKREAPGVQVTTADAYGVMLLHPSVVSAVDIVFVNYYPYWENISVEYAIAAIHGWHQLVTAKAGGKPVVVSETGWPSCGDRRGDAVPSPENASSYFLNFVSWARANNVSYFYFEAFDESWKVKDEGPQGACWGIWNKSGNLKPGMQDVFDNKTIQDNWSGTAIPGGPGDPIIEFTYVPQYGSFENLRGQVWHVRPANYTVDGSWTCDITTGGNDPEATAIAAYLVPQ